MSGEISSTTMPAIDNGSSQILQKLNDEKAETLIPAMVVFGILMVLGIVGNSLVCYVFGFRLKHGTQNFLIICLAVFDLLSCTISIPTEIADMRYYYMFRSEAACKIMRFIATISATGSILTLLVIAIDRYRKICKPFKNQMHLEHVKLSLIPIILGALLFSWPAILLYGIRTTETEISGLMGQTCSTPDGLQGTVYPFIYNGILLIAFVILMVTLIVLYFFILRETNRHNRYMKRNSDFNLPSMDSIYYHTDSSESSVDSHPVADNAAYSPTEDMPNSEGGDVFHTSVPVAPMAINMDYPTNPPELHQRSRQDECNDEGPSGCNGGSSNCNGVSNTSTSTPPKHSKSSRSSSFESTNTEISFVESFRSSSPRDNSQSQNGSPTKRPSILHVSTNGNRHSQTSHISILEPKPSFLKKSRLKIKRRFFRNKTTVIAFSVTAVFILSFLPHLSLQVAKFGNENFDYHLDGSALVAYNIFLRSHILNSVSNPVIYGVFNSEFREQVKKLGRRFHWKLPIQ